MQPKPTHYGFGDESHWNQGRYRTLSIVTLPATVAPTVSEGIRTIASANAVDEFAWKGVRTRSRQKLAQELCEFALDNVRERAMRINTLIWDTHDSRHDVRGRDDAENLARMYYQVMKDVVVKRWPTDAQWKMHVDERADIDWRILRDSVYHGVRKAKRTRQLDLGRGIEIERQGVDIVEAKSSVEPLVQLADLFAGLGAFSWNRAESYWQWQLGQTGQAQLFAEFEKPALSKSEAYKADTLSHLRTLCSQREVPLSHELAKGLRTKNPADPFNFWFYTPQRERDKAPRRHR